MTTAPVDSDQARELLLRALNHDAVADAVTELLFEHVVGGRYERSEVAGLLRLRIQDPFHAATGEDWEALAEAYAASAGDLDPAALGETGAGRVHEYDGTRFDVGLLREFLATLLADEASVDRIADATAGAGGHEASPSVIAKGLRSAAARALLSPSKEDWGAVADQLIAQAREIDAEGRLGFYDLSRQRYAKANPIREAGEFQIGEYDAGGSLGQGGEFKVTLIELGNGGRWGLYPHLEVFGEGKAALRDAIDAGILDILGPVASGDEFARRLIAIGIVDRSDAALSRNEAAIAGAR
ncbi:MAG TPA: hypothetical protein VLK56_07860 [Solirubrobacterales bacterium]|nr:hypothetical protein [Solirubrobacterales bacterium]